MSVDEIKEKIVDLIMESESYNKNDPKYTEIFEQVKKLKSKLDEKL